MDAEDRDIVMKRFQTNLPTVRGVNGSATDHPNTDLNPLAYRKGKGRYCQLCFKKAYFTCQKCRQANYCSKEHKSKDMDDFHPLVCEQMEYIGARPPFSIFKEEREIYKQSVVIKIKELLEIAQAKAKESLLRNDPDHAVTRSSYIHRYSAMLFRKTDPRHIPPVLINAEALALQGKLDEAKTMLVKCDMILTMNTGNALHKTEYYRTEGVINTLEQNYIQSLTSFAEEVYWATEMFHPEHPRVARGYFNMGSTFLKFHRKRTAFSFFKHAVDIWLKRLVEVFQVVLAIHENANPLMAHQIDIDLTEEESLLMNKSLDFIVTVLTSNMSDISKEQLIEVYYALAHLYYLRSKFNKGRTMVDKACELITGSSERNTVTMDTHGPDSLSSSGGPHETLFEMSDRSTLESTFHLSSSGVRFTTRWDKDITPLEASKWLEKLKQFRKYCRRHSV